MVLGSLSTQQDRERVRAIVEVTGLWGVTPGDVVRTLEVLEARGNDYSTRAICDAWSYVQDQNAEAETNV